MTAQILDELEGRGLIAQSTDRVALEAHLSSGSRTLYCGFDPTADSLHVGSLVPLLALRRFQLAGHRPILLLGGATGLIGDPSGKTEERTLNAESVVAGYVDSIQRQTRRFLEFDGPNGALVVNNLDWTARRSVIEFLRDVGKHFSVNRMIQRDSVKTRLEREDQGISYTEFSYMLLQAMDFLELARVEQCSLQIGGSDQWGNMVSGTDLIRRSLKQEAHVLTLPLITRADGSKFGKTADGAIWLDAAKTSPYKFYQFWLNVADDDVIDFLRYFTFLEPGAIQDLASSQDENPAARAAQRALAEAMTELVHGPEALAGAQRITEVLFSGSVALLTEADAQALQSDGMDSTLVRTLPVGVLDALTASGLAQSNGAARKLVQSRALTVNGQRVDDPQAALNAEEALFGKFFFLRRGKKRWHLLVLDDRSEGV